MEGLFLRADDVSFRKASLGTEEDVVRIEEAKAHGLEGRYCVSGWSLFLNLFFLFYFLFHFIYFRLKNAHCAYFTPNTNKNAYVVR